MSNQEYLAGYVSELIGLITSHLDVELAPAVEVEIIRVILDVYQDYVNKENINETSTNINR